MTETEITTAWSGSVWADSDYRRELLVGLVDACDIRTILEKAGRHDLAEWAWGNLCPGVIPVRIRHDALKRAGYPFAVPHR